MSNSFERGLEELINLHGNRGVKAVENYQNGSNDLGQYIVQYAYGEIYAREGLDAKKRSTSTLSILIALGDCDEELYHHFLGALQIGLTATEIEEIIIHSSVYCGFPRALGALAIWKKVLSEKEESKSD